MTSSEWLQHPELLELLASADLEVEGRLSDASNTTLRCRAEVGGAELLCVVKPVAGERPLWDFPEWTLTHREIAAFELSEALGWHLVPPTVWRTDGPGGEGMCQLWIDEDPQASQVQVVRPGGRIEGFVHVLDAEDGSGRAVELVHAATDDVARIAIFDVLVNNADRKGGHVLTDVDGRVWAIDHGVTFAVDEKLRTVLWGWAGDPVPESVMTDVERLHDTLGDSFDAVDRWLADEERQVLRDRVRRLLRQRTFPLPGSRWPAIPWPVF
ncbi:MAG: SCO1664 family protein [Actinomycetales bacterium]|nr:SCO1664 family protein [Actinomycetales bacterium]